MDYSCSDVKNWYFTKNLCDTKSSVFIPRLIIDTPFSNRTTISNGLIVYANDTKRFALIQRKHSAEFLLFVRGLYRISHLPILLSNITLQEANIINQCLINGPEQFTQVFTEINMDVDGLEYGLIRMAESRNVVTKLLKKLDLSYNQLSWSWPKGRLNISSTKETPFECAKREFIEEVEINLPSPLYVSDTYINENIRTITGRNIESRYWIYVIPNEIPMSPPVSHPEVSNRNWFDLPTCRKLVNNNILFDKLSLCLSTIQS